MSFLQVALALSLKVLLCPFIVHDRLRPRELIGFADNSRFLSRFRHMAEFLVCRLWSVGDLSIKLDKYRQIMIIVCIFVLDAKKCSSIRFFPAECPFKGAGSHNVSRLLSKRRFCSIFDQPYQSDFPQLFEDGLLFFEEKQPNHS